MTNSTLSGPSEAHTVEGPSVEISSIPDPVCGRAVNGPSRFATELGKDLGEDRSESGVEDADELVVGPGRVQERTEEIKDGALPRFPQSPANGNDGFEGGVVKGGKKKSCPDGLEAAAEFLGRQIDAYSESFEDVGSAALGGDAAIPMFHDRNTVCREQEDARGRDVEEIQLVATCSAHVE